MGSLAHTPARGTGLRSMIHLPLPISMPAGSARRNRHLVWAAPHPLTPPFLRTRSSSRPPDIGQVSGGIYGNEELATAAPPGFVMLGIVICPIIFSIPVTFIMGANSEFAHALNDRPCPGVRTPPKHVKQTQTRQLSLPLPHPVLASAIPLPTRHPIHAV